jgi:hypothetical protein
MDQPNKEQKHDHIALYVVYAAAAYFGFTFLLKGGKAKAAVIDPNKVAEPPHSYAAVKTPAYVPATNTNYQSTISSKTTWIAESFPLRKGMKGASVRQLQQKLGVSADGAFGAKTEAALLQQYGSTTMSKAQFQSLFSTITASGKSSVSAKSSSADTSTILKSGSRGPDVYRLQKWLGFKDKKVAKKGEPIADSIFGKQTLSALQKKTAQSFISVDHLAALQKQIGGFATGIASGFAGEVIVTNRTATILNNNLIPLHTVPRNTILGTRLMELTDPQQQKTYTQFRTIDGLYRWVEKDAA